MSLTQKMLEINNELVRILAECEQLRSDQKTLQQICSMGKQRITELQAELRKACAERDEAKENAGRLQAELDATRKQLQDVCSAKPAGQSDLVRDVSHYIEAAEVDRPTTIHPPEYTPPEGWRVLRYGELLQPGDQWVNWEGTVSRPDILHGDGTTASGGRYIRQIKPEPQPEPEPEQDGVLVQEGWWLQADGNRVYVRPTNPTASNKGKIAQGYVWSDGARLYHSDGGHGDTPTPHDLVKFLGKELQPAEPQQSQPEPEFKPYTFAAYIVGDKSQPDALRIVWATEEWIQHSQFSIVHRMKDMQFFGNDGGCNITEYHETLTLNLKIQ